MKSLLKKILRSMGYKIVPQWSIVTDARQMKNLLYCADLYKLAENVSGNVVECGVGRGRTFLYFSYLLSRGGKGRDLWGFDSFEGFPEPTAEDASARNPKKGEWSGVSPENILSVLRVAGIPEDFILHRVHLVKGFVEDTLRQYDRTPIALLHIDLDLYQAYTVTLEMLVPFVAKGGVVLFDEYGVTRWPGATKAVDEFLQKHPYLLRQHPSGKFYFIKE